MHVVMKWETILAWTVWKLEVVRFQRFGWETLMVFFLMTSWEGTKTMAPLLFTSDM